MLPDLSYTILRNESHMQARFWKTRGETFEDKGNRDWPPDIYTAIARFESR